MKLLIPGIAALTLSVASLSAGAALKSSDLFGEAAQAPFPSLEHAVVTAAANRTIVVTGETKWVNVQHFEVIRFVSNGREFAWYFDGLAQPSAFDLTQIAPAGFVDHSVTVYVSPGERDFPGG